jgi:hypothetical protein
MILSNNLLSKRLVQLAVLLLLATSIVTLTAQATLAIPLKPILDQMGRRLIQEIFDVAPTDQPTPPATQPSPNVQQENFSSPESPSDPSGSLPSPYPSTSPAYQPGSEDEQGW